MGDLIDWRFRWSLSECWGCFVAFNPITSLTWEGSFCCFCGTCCAFLWYILNLQALVSFIIDVRSYFFNTEVEPLVLPDLDQALPANEVK